MPDNNVVTVVRVGEGGQEYSWDFIPAKLKQKSKTDPVRYAYVPVVPKTAEEEETFFNWVTRKQLIAQGVAKVRAMSTIWSENATPEGGEFDPEKFKAFASVFSARGETYKALNDEKNRLMLEMISISQNTKLTPPEIQAKIQEIGTRLAEISDALTEKEKAREAAKAAGRSEDEEETAEVETT